MKKMLTIVCDQDFSYEHQVPAEHSAQQSFLVFSKEKNTSCTVKIHLNETKTCGNIHIIGIAHRQHLVHIDGQIIIGPAGFQASGHLQEEVILLGNYSNTYTKPVLDVWNNQVSASHGAKIHSIDPLRLFYLESRGLSTRDAKKLIIHGIIASVFDEVDENDIHIVGNIPQKQTKNQLIMHILESIVEKRSDK